MCTFVPRGNVNPCPKELREDKTSDIKKMREKVLKTNEKSARKVKTNSQRCVVKKDKRYVELWDKRIPASQGNKLNYFPGWKSDYD